MTRQSTFYFHREAVFAVFCTFLTLWLLGLVLINTKYLNPLFHALKDFEFTDFYYTLRKDEPKDLIEDIILVNIGSKDREGIAEMVTILSNAGPSVIGLDVYFPELKEHHSDSLLKNALHPSVPIILATPLEYSLGDKDTPKIKKNNAFFEIEHKEGYGSFVSKDKSTIRHFKPFIKIDEDTIFSFAARISKIHDASKFENLLNRRGKPEYIHYAHSHFVIIDSDSLYAGSAVLNLIKNNIVLLGYLGDPDKEGNMEDLHLTPFNKSFGGHAIPDMYGVEIHAHILNMILRDKYIHEPKNLFVGLLAFFITLLHIYPFLFYFVKKHIWFHIIAKCIQLVSSGMIFITAMYLFHLYAIRIEPALLIYCVILSVDILYFMDGIAKYLYRNFNIQSYFIENHSIT